MPTSVKRKKPCTMTPNEVMHRLREVYSTRRSDTLIDIEGDLVRPTRNTINLLRLGLTCQRCDATATHVVKVKYKGTHHIWKLRFFTTHADGHEDLLTVDHVMPLIEGGSWRMSNLQTMCYRCNNVKGCTLHWFWWWT